MKRNFVSQTRKVRRKRAKRNAKVAAESGSAVDETETEIETAENVASAAGVGVGKSGKRMIYDRAIYLCFCVVPSTPLSLIGVESGGESGHHPVREIAIGDAKRVARRRQHQRK